MNKPRQSYTEAPRIHHALFKKHGFNVVDVAKTVMGDIARLEADPTNRISTDGRNIRDNLRAMQILRNQLGMELAVADGRALHLYMPDEAFCDWLINCVPTLLPEYYQVLEAMFDNRVCVVHFPASSKYRPIMYHAVVRDYRLRVHQSSVPAIVAEVGILGPNANYLEISGEFDGKTVEDLSAIYDAAVAATDRVVKASSRDTGSAAIARAPDINGEIDNGSQYIKLIAGIALYVDCFGEALVDGVPTDLKHPAHHAHKSSKTIGIVDKIKQSLGGTHASPSAHYRVGHFRILKSERYVNKRFQTIWVDGVFVKGRSKTVLTPEAVDAKEETKTFAFGEATENSQDEGSRVLQGSALETAR